MPEFRSQIIFFDKPGAQNTGRTLELAQDRGNDLAINTFVVASTFGDTGRDASGLLKNKNVIVVTHMQGFKGPNTQELSDENRRIIEASGARILTVQHTMAGINRAIRLKMNTYQPDEIIADVLRLFGAGMKVMLEISMMAADAGLIEVGKPIIAIAGTNHGADMAAVVLPANSINFFDLRILEIICMPSENHPGFSK